MNRPKFIIVLAALATLFLGLWVFRLAFPPATPAPTATPATTPSTTTTSMPATRRIRPPTTQILDILRTDNPHYPTTRPFDTPLELRFSDHFIVYDPVYLDQQGHLWITRADAPDRFEFKDAPAVRNATHITRDHVVFACWLDQGGRVRFPNLVVKSRSGKGFELVNRNGRRQLDDPHGFLWHRAILLPTPEGVADRIVVPTATGVCAFAFDDKPTQILESHSVLIDPAKQDPARHAIQMIMDNRGVIAWVTDDTGTRGARGVARFAPRPSSKDYNWTVLTGTVGWPDGLLHVVPLRDDSVLQITSGTQKDSVEFSLTTLEKHIKDEATVQRLIAQLSSASTAARGEAFKRLNEFGPNIAPLLEQAIKDQPLETHARLRQLLKSRLKPTLSGMTLINPQMRLMERFANGGVLFFAEEGVTVPGSEEAPDTIAPAWITVRPGRYVELLPQILSEEMRPDQHRLTLWGREDFVLYDSINGIRHLMGSRLEKILRRSEIEFSALIGIDATGRWLLKNPLDASKGTLIIDPRLPDTTPRLPYWELPVSAGKSGWDDADWPVIFVEIKTKDGDKVQPWAMDEFNWRVMDPDKETVHLKTPPPLPARSIRIPATAPTTQPSTQPTTQSATKPAEHTEQRVPLLIEPDGTAYYDGLESLLVELPGGRTFRWPLPDDAVGEGKATLLRSNDGLLFLINRPGQVIRIRRHNDPAQPFVVEAIFERGVPKDEFPHRIWIDRAQRLCFAHEDNKITIMFTNGRIPPSISEKMPADQMPNLDDE